MDKHKGLVGQFVKEHDLTIILDTAWQLERAIRRNRRSRVRMARSKLRDDMKLDRMRVFAVHGCKCDLCGRVGNKIIETVDNGGAKHIDLYAYADGQYMLMNRDHILPRSLKGGNELWNLRPTCCSCNSKRGNVVENGDNALIHLRLQWNRWVNMFYDHAGFLPDKLIVKASRFLAKLSFWA